MINELPKSGPIKLKKELEISTSELKNVIQGKIINSFKKIPNKFEDYQMHENNIICFCSPKNFNFNKGNFRIRHSSKFHPKEQKSLKIR